MSHQTNANQGHTAHPQKGSGGTSIRSPIYSLLPSIPRVVSNLPGSRGTRLSKGASFLSSPTNICSQKIKAQVRICYVLVTLSQSCSAVPEFHGRPFMLQRVRELTEGIPTAFRHSPTFFFSFQQSRMLFSFPLQLSCLVNTCKNVPFYL